MFSLMRHWRNTHLVRFVVSVSNSRFYNKCIVLYKLGFLFKVVGRELLLHLIDHYLTQYSTNSTIQQFLDTTFVHIMPTMNPDGYNMSREGDCDSVEGRYLIIYLLHDFCLLIKPMSDDSLNHRFFFLFILFAPINIDVCFSIHTKRKCHCSQMAIPVVVNVMVRWLRENSVCRVFDSIFWCFYLFPIWCRGCDMEFGCVFVLVCNYSAVFIFDKSHLMPKPTKWTVRPAKN